MKKTKRFLGIVLSLAIILAIVPFQAFAAPTGLVTNVANSEGVPNTFREGASPNVLTIPAKIWDQRYDGKEFEMAGYGLQYGLVQDNLDPVTGNPVLTPGMTSTTNGAAYINFDRWYNERLDANCDHTAHAKGNCTSCKSMEFDAELTFTKRVVNGRDLYEYNGTSGGTFFPFANGRGVLVDEANAVARANQFSKGEAYNGENFYFTMKMETQFTYQGGETFEFSGDDDVWVFIDGKLALDIGGVHSKIGGTIQFGSSASGSLAEGHIKSVVNGSTRYADKDLGLEEGQTYTLSFFYAERHTSTSNLKISTTLQMDSFDVAKQGVLSEDKSGIDYLITLSNTQKNVPINITHVADWMNEGDDFDTDGGYVTFGKDQLSGLSYSYEKDGVYTPVTLNAPDAGSNAFKLDTPIELQKAGSTGDTIYFKYTYTLSEAEKASGGQLFNKFVAKTEWSDNNKYTVVRIGTEVTSLADISVTKEAAEYVDGKVFSDYTNWTGDTALVGLGRKAIFKITLKNDGAAIDTVTLSDVMTTISGGATPSGTLYNSGGEEVSPGGTSVAVPTTQDRVFYYVTDVLSEAGTYRNTASIAGYGANKDKSTDSADIEVAQLYPYTVNYFYSDSDEPFYTAEGENKLGGLISYEDTADGVEAVSGLTFDRDAYSTQGIVDREGATVTGDSGEDIVNVRFPIRTDLSYKIEYYQDNGDGTRTLLQAETRENQTYGTVITEEDIDPVVNDYKPDFYKDGVYGREVMPITIKDNSVVIEIIYSMELEDIDDGETPLNPGPTNPGPIEKIVDGEIPKTGREDELFGLLLVLCAGALVTGMLLKVKKSKENRS